MFENWYEVLETAKMKNEIIFYIEESMEGGYEARALGHSIFTEGETIEELKNNIRDSIHCHFEEADMPQVNLLDLAAVVDHGPVALVDVQLVARRRHV